jgi:hypothetical protein
MLTDSIRPETRTHGERRRRNKRGLEPNDRTPESRRTKWFKYLRDLSQYRRHRNTGVQRGTLLEPRTLQAQKPDRTQPILTISLEIHRAHVQK